MSDRPQHGGGRKAAWADAVACAATYRRERKMQACQMPRRRGPAYISTFTSATGSTEGGTAHIWEYPCFSGIKTNTGVSRGKEEWNFIMQSFIFQKWAGGQHGEVMLHNEERMCRAWGWCRDSRNEQQSRATLDVPGGKPAGRPTLQSRSLT